MQEFSLIENNQFIVKLLEIYRTIEMRHCLMIVGETMTGKSTALQVLGKH